LIKVTVDEFDKIILFHSKFISQIIVSYFY
jgi:hypothetical protein